MLLKKIEKDSVLFKINYNTRILLEKKQGVNYDNINPRGPFPTGQNLLVVVDSIDDDIDDYLQPDDESGDKNYNKNRHGNKSDDSDSKRGKSKDNQNEKESFNIKQKPKINRRRFDEFSDISYTKVMKIIPYMMIIWTKTRMNLMKKVLLKVLKKT